MKVRARGAAAIFAAGAWINLSEFFRNELLLGTVWKSHFANLGLSFPSTPTAGMVWGIWGFTFAAVVYTVSRSSSLSSTTLICWLAGFVLMWLVSWNLLVLPQAVLPYAIPLSLLETFIAAVICVRIAPPSHTEGVIGH
jgi:hypothetical protein